MQFEQASQFIINKLRNDLQANFIYHNIDHTLDVRHAAENIGLKEGISADDMKLLLTAAIFHDAGFLTCVKGHEKESCKMIKDILPLYQYTAPEIELISSIIMATRLPQSPKNHLGQILADADLDYLGRDDFFTIGNNLYQELLLAGTISNEIEWNQSQLNFMENHHYFTKTSINLRQAKKMNNIDIVKALLLNTTVK